MARRTTQQNGKPFAEALSQNPTSGEATTEDGPTEDAPPEDAPLSAKSFAPKENPRETTADAQGKRASEPAPPGLADKAGRAISRRPFIALLLAILILGGLTAGLLYWRYASQFETTDDAFIAARTVAVSTQVAGQVVALPVTDNQLVQKGGVLLKIDPRNYAAALDQAEAQVEQAKADIKVLAAQVAAQQAKIDQAKRAVTQAKGALDFARQENDRFQKLYQTGAGTHEAAQQRASNLIERKAAYAGAQAAQQAAERQIAVLQAQQHQAQATLDQAKAQLEIAEANLQRTVIRAPVTGYTTEITTAKGDYAPTGQTLMMFVPKEVWVIANFKETQLDKMRVGQPVDIHIDAYPERDFKGHVASIQAGSGAAFSLLPPENATGNYVKIVQRVPVKIAFDKPLSVYVGPGMSVEPRVKVR